MVKVEGKDETPVSVGAQIPQWLKDDFEAHARKQDRSFSAQLRKAMVADMEEKANT